MKNFSVFVIVIGILTVSQIFAGETNWMIEPPVLKLYEVDESDNMITLYNRINNQFSEAIIENVDHLRVECQADYPVQLIYEGNGLSILSNVSWSTNYWTKKFTASVFLSPLKEHHTGKYQCIGTEHLTRSPYLYIYVPGQALFTSLKGKTIQIPKYGSPKYVLLPCSVSHPHVQVSILKVDGKAMREPVTKSNNAISYDTRAGFRINLNEIEDPEGTYVCTASYNALVRRVEHTVTSKSFRPPEKSEEICSGGCVKRCETHTDCPSGMDCYTDHTCRVPPERCSGESCGQPCETHDDCPLGQSCYTDRTCRDPCTYSMRCGKAALCRNVGQQLECYCPSGFTGDPAKECLSISWICSAHGYRVSPSKGHYNSQIGNLWHF